ncbi:MAG: MASE1 domain-containing protein [Simplicispira sp.]|nr:MASE1 domain-containing protein [Simplicispira sp.]
MPLHRPPPPRLAFAAATLLYMLVADMAPPHWPDVPFTPLFLPEGGLALAWLLLGGQHYLVSVLAGALLVHALTPGISDAAMASQALAATVAAGLGAWLLQRVAHFDVRCHSFRACRQLLVYGGGAGAGAGALAGATALLASGEISASAWPTTLLQWWMGNALGTVLVTALALSWWNTVRNHLTLRRLPEGVLAYGLSLVAGQIVFSHWRNDLLEPVAYGYWMFLFVTWAGVRLGMLGTVRLLCLIALQGLWSMSHGTGFFADDIIASHGFGYGSYMAILSLVGMSLAAYFSERHRQNATLRIAAIAFECQEGLLITDPHQVILQANQSFLKMSGYAANEVLGQTPHFFRAPSPDGKDTPASALQAAPLGQAVQRQEWHRRKSGALYPVWVGITPVLDDHGHTTHCVITMIDITHQHTQEAERRQREQAHRDALVREVHHRIKNNLQGILGMMHQFNRTHPTVQGPMTQLIGQVQSIAVIHGLQGRANIDQVRLCELTCAVATGLQTLWQVPIALDIPHGWQPCRLHHSEAVPVALVLNELILNAIKHGGKSHQDVHIVLRKGLRPDTVHITISNPGQWPQPALIHAPAPADMTTHMGLDLVAALMPRSGAALAHRQLGQRAVVELELSPPVIQLEGTVSP